MEGSLREVIDTYSSPPLFLSFFFDETYVKYFSMSDQI